MNILVKAFLGAQFYQLKIDFILAKTSFAQLNKLRIGVLIKKLLFLGTSLLVKN